MRALILYMLIVLVSWSNSLYAQSEIVEMEYYVDVDPGLGTATAITGFTSAEQVVDYVSSLANSYDLGQHIIGIRAKDDNGQWSHTRFSSFTTVKNPPASAIVAGEYFVDEDPGLGLATALSSISPSAIVNDWLTSFATTADVGSHVIGIRVTDDAGQWSHTRFGMLRVITSPDPAQAIVALEYIWDTDEGYAETGMVYLDTPSDLLELETVDVPVPDEFEVGSQHLLAMRALDNYGRWSHNVYCNAAIEVYELATDTLVVDSLVCEDFTTLGGLVITADSMFTELILTDDDVLQATDYSIDVLALEVFIEPSGNDLQGPLGMDSYQWVDCNDGFTPIAGAVESIFTPEATGSYALEVTLSDCSSTSSCLDFEYENPDGLGDGNALESVINYYPNPLAETLIIDLGSAIAGADFSLIDPSGRLVMQHVLNAGIQELSLPNLESGMYLIRFSTALGVYTDCMVKL